MLRASFYINKDLLSVGPSQGYHAAMNPVGANSTAPAAKPHSHLRPRQESKIQKAPTHGSMQRKHGNTSGRSRLKFHKFTSHRNDHLAVHPMQKEGSLFDPSRYIFTHQR